MPHVNHFFSFRFVLLSHFRSLPPYFFAATRRSPVTGLQGSHGGGGGGKTISHHALHTISAPPPRAQVSMGDTHSHTGCGGTFRRPSHRPPIVRHRLRIRSTKALMLSRRTSFVNRSGGRGPARQPPGARGTPFNNNTNVGVFAPCFSFCALPFHFPDAPDGKTCLKRTDAPHFFLFFSPLAARVSPVVVVISTDAAANWQRRRRVSRHH